MRSEAPLFFSVADNLPDDHDHDQEVQDLYALQSSRRHFGAYTSSTVDEDERDGLGESSDSIPDPRRDRGKKSPLEPGVKSAWRSGLAESSSTITPSQRKDKGKDKLEDIRLDDSVRLDMEPERIDHSDMMSPDIPRRVAGPSRSQPPDDIAIEIKPSDYMQDSEYYDRPSSSRMKLSKANFMPTQIPPNEMHQSLSRSVPAPVAHPTTDPPMHDRHWRSLYLLSMTGMFATGFLSWLQTDESSLSKLVDTVHTAIHSHIHLLAVDSLVAVGVSLAWMYMLRRFVKLLMYSLLVSVPIILVAMSSWQMVQSYKGKWGGNSSQDKAMRWASIIPMFMSALWVWMAYRGRHAMGRAMAIIQLACKILGENPSLIVLSFGTLAGTIAFTWIWVGMFQTVFLYGKIETLLGGVPIFKLDWTTWALGAYFIVMYLWTLGVLSGFQRATSAATVSQWYYYRHSIPAVPSGDVMDAAIHHSTSILFGTICFSSFAALMVRLPLYVLHRYIVGLIHLICFYFIASPINALTHPLTLTYAAVHSQPLIASSRAISEMRFIDTSGFGAGHHPRAAYRLARMLLTGTRAVMALSLGVGAWVGTTRGSGEGVLGSSTYGYIVGMIAGAIGWGVLGATEGSLSNVVDACLICVGSEPGEGTHCREAHMVFGG